MNIIVIRNKKNNILISFITIFFFIRKYVKNKIPKIITIKLKDFETNDGNTDYLTCNLDLIKIWLKDKHKILY